jgi:CRISPR type III-associated protein (TIGR04423 family)
MIGKTIVSDTRGLDLLPVGKYEGYVWVSDEQNPMVYFNDVIQLTLVKNAFVVEALLWDIDQKRSVHIRHTGQQMLTVYDLNDLRKREHPLSGEVKFFLGHRISGVKKLRFLQTYEDMEDPACDGMKVSTPAELIFLGFEHNSLTVSEEDKDKEPFFDPWVTPGQNPTERDNHIFFFFLK